MIDRYEAARVVHRLRGRAPVIAGPGALSGALYVCGYEPATLYNMELGYSAAMAFGLAIARPEEKVIAFEGDGSLVAGMTILATTGRYQPPNLILLVMDDQVYASTADGRRATVTGCGTSLRSVALACGLPPGQVSEADTLAAFETGLQHALRTPGPHVIVAKLDVHDDSGHHGRRPRPDRDIAEVAINFKRNMLERATQPGDVR
ncbi:thiamine pyrophosphate-dependent enzyme [Amycolatopsis jejuensis]|uniref:thiamine pyrophosphate-dependent enzyme n=1 Tax=Amycolatopsis jejuensis TaxID=330084 RepID=UPI00068D92C8|nr:thiamine pyrophosphate-dependent enzyme [Amycolatopsis jejuensis]